MTISLYAPATINPPIDEKAWVYPRTLSRRFGSSKSSASQATAATNSTQTPIKVVERRTRSINGDVLNPAAKAERAYKRMLQTRTRRRPRRSVRYPPIKPKNPPASAGM